MIGIDAFFDPPFILTLGKGMHPIAVSVLGETIDPVTSTAIGAQPVSTVSPVTGPTKVDPKPTSTKTPIVFNPDPTPKTPGHDQPSPTPLIVTIGSQTLIPGAPPVTISSHVFSLAPSATAIIIDGTTSLLPPPLPPTSAMPFVGQPSNIKVSAEPSVFILGGQTLSAGGSAITISGATYSLAPTGNAVVVDSTTQHFAQPGSSSYMVAGQTLVAGGSAFTVSGTVLRLLPGGSSVVVGGTTQAVGGYIEASTTNAGFTRAVISLGGFATPTNASEQSPTSKKSDER